MTNPSLQSAVYVEDDAALRQLVDQLTHEPLLAIDTESNSLHVYHEMVCLIQLSTRTQDYIIDPIAIGDMQPLGKLMADPKIEKVFHAAEYDIGCMKRDFGFVFNNLFDTMWAARICGYKAFGLGSLLLHFFDVKMDKRHQRDDWGNRPLPEDSLHYAQMDTHYLPELHDMLFAEIRSKGAVEEARELFEEVTQTPSMVRREYDPDEFWFLGRPHSLTRKQLAILRELCSLRDEIAQHKDLPPFKVFTNKVLINIASAEPHFEGEFHQIDGISSWQIREYGNLLIDAVDKGRVNKLPKPPRHRPPSAALAARYSLLNNWRRERARERGVAVDVIISKNTLWELARSAPATMTDMEQVHGIGPWRLQTYGPELIELIRHHSNGNR